MAIEIKALRQENSKTYDLGAGRRQLVASIGAIHYKDDYASKTEGWKDIDLTWVDNKITKAPFELTLENNKVTIRDKKTSKISTIELLSVFPAGLAFEIVPENSRVSFRHTLPTDKIPFEASFKVTGKGLITTKAFDDEGELVLDTTLVDGVLTERMSSIRDKKTGQVRPAKGQIKVDPTWVVGAADDDCESAWNTSTSNWDFWRPSRAGQTCGYYSANEMKIGGGMRWRSVTIPQGSTITAAQLIFTARDAISATTVNTRITGEAADNAAAFSDVANFKGRRGTIVGGANNNYITSAQVDWDAIPAWSTNEKGTDTTSPEIKTIIQEQINRAGWAGDALVLFWDDFDNRSTNSSARYRQGYSWSGDAAKTVELVVTYTASVAPTVTTQAASAVGKFGATGNGNITSTGGVNATRRGFCYMEGTSGDPTTANSVAYDDGDFGAGAYTKAITGLKHNTGYRVRAYAVNSVGTGYGDTVQLTTLEATGAIWGFFTWG